MIRTWNGPNGCAPMTSATSTCLAMAPWVCCFEQTIADAAEIGTLTRGQPIAARDDEEHRADAGHDRGPDDAKRRKLGRDAVLPHVEHRDRNDLRLWSREQDRHGDRL